MPPEDKPLDRRRFFRQSLRELLRPLAEVIEPIEDVLRQITDMDDLPGANKVAQEHWLRPPGAMRETQFRETCSRCGECVKVCPAQCIKIDSTGKKGHGAPYIEIDSMPCVVCDGLQCMHVCPTGALAPVPLGDIDMGTAVWNAHVCVRKDGENCTICIDQCPVGSVAIELRDNDVLVHPEGCIGCGVCQFYCPTSPKSIVVIPKAAREI